MTCEAEDTERGVGVQLRTLRFELHTKDSASNGLLRYPSEGLAFNFAPQDVGCIVWMRHARLSLARTRPPPPTVVRLAIQSVIPLRQINIDVA